jgi:hypothetical protein
MYKCLKKVCLDIKNRFCPYGIVLRESSTQPQSDRVGRDSVKQCMRKTAVA